MKLIFRLIIVAMFIASIGQLRADQPPKKGDLIPPTYVSRLEWRAARWPLLHELFLDGRKVGAIDALAHCWWPYNPDRGVYGEPQPLLPTRP